jgi:hypothetical protein
MTDKNTVLLDISIHPHTLARSACSWPTRQKVYLRARGMYASTTLILISNKRNRHEPQHQSIPC